MMHSEEGTDLPYSLSMIDYFKTGTQGASREKTAMGDFSSFNCRDFGVFRVFEP